MANGIALNGAQVDEAVFTARPDYRALLLTVTGVHGGPSDEASEAALLRAEGIARSRLAGASPETLVPAPQQAVPDPPPGDQ